MAITEDWDIPTIPITLIIRTILALRTILTTRPTHAIPTVRTIAVFLGAAPFLMLPARLRLDQIR